MTSATAAGPGGHLPDARRRVDHLTSGRFRARVPSSALGALVNAGLEEFVQVAALEMPRGVRLNVVSPPWVRESGAVDGVPVADVAACYIRAIAGPMTGRVIVPAAS